MSAGATSPVNAGTWDNTAASFARSEPPFLRYLDTLRECGGVEVGETADALRKDLYECKRYCDHPNGAIANVSQLLAQYLAECKEPVAQVIDLCAAPGPVDVHEHGALVADPNVSIDETIKTFVSKLHVCANDVHTRLVLLRDPSNKGTTGETGRPHATPEAPGRAQMLAWKLLCFHLLGVELDVRPHDIMQLLSRPQSGATRFVNRPSMLHLDVKTANEDRISSSKYLGWRAIGTASPYLVIILLNDAFSPSGDGHGDDLFDGTYDLPSASMVLNGNCHVALDEALSTFEDRPLSFFVHMLRGQAASLKALSKGQPCGVWLLPLLLRHLAQVSDSAEWFREEDWSPGQLEWSRILRTIRVRLSADIRSIRLMQAIAGYASDDVSAFAIDALDHLASHIADELCEQTERINAFVRQKGIENAELSIRESRSGIALTTLAFAFVPLSLASSIFGMNIQEINGSGHSIWTFVVTALALVLTSCMCWLLWRVWRNLQHGVRSVQDYDEIHSEWVQVKRKGLIARYGSLGRLLGPMYVALYGLLHAEERWSSKLALLTGWRSAEKEV